MPSEFSMGYRGPRFRVPDFPVSTYKDDYFQKQIDLESDLFFELRKANDWKPHRLSESSPKELDEIRNFFHQNKDGFYFYFKENALAASLLHLGNFIQALCVARPFQRQGIGSLLTKYAVNQIFDRGFDTVTLKVFQENTKAISLYQKLGFIIEKTPE